MTCPAPSPSARSVPYECVPERLQLDHPGQTGWLRSTPCLARPVSLLLRDRERASLRADSHGSTRRVCCSAPSDIARLQNVPTARSWRVEGHTAPTPRSLGGVLPCAAILRARVELARRSAILQTRVGLARHRGIACRGLKRHRRRRVFGYGGASPLDDFPGNGSKRLARPWRWPCSLTVPDPSRSPAPYGSASDMGLSAAFRDDFRTLRRTVALLIYGGIFAGGCTVQVLLARFHHSLHADLKVLAQARPQEQPADEDSPSSKSPKSQSTAMPSASRSPARRGRTRSRMDAVLAVETALMGCLHWATISVLPNVLEFRYTDIFEWGPHLVDFTPFAMWLVSVYSTAEWLLRGVTNKGRALWLVSIAIASSDSRSTSSAG
jgi:hypothetical protein